MVNASFTLDHIPVRITANIKPCQAEVYEIISKRVERARDFREIIMILKHYANTYNLYFCIT